MGDNLQRDKKKKKKKKKLLKKRKKRKKKKGFYIEKYHVNPSFTRGWKSSKMNCWPMKKKKKEKNSGVARKE